MLAQQITYFVLVFFSAASLGALAMSAILDLKMKDVVRFGLYRAITKLGVILIVGTILWLVIPQQVIDPQPQTIVYLVGLLLTCIGGFGTTVSTITYYVEREEHAGVS